LAAVRRGSKAKDAALGGVSVALILLSLYAANYVKNNTVFFLVLSNYLSAIPYIKGRIAFGLEVYCAALLLAIFVIPDKIYIISYAITGLYPLIKLLCESRTVVVEFILKLLYYNISIVSLLVIYDSIMNTNIISLIWPLSLKTAAIIAAGEGFFLVYDFVFTKFINYINIKLMGGIGRWQQ
jgi:hypothetical protein